MNTGADRRYDLYIKPLKRAYLAASVLFLVLATTFALQERSRRVQEKTLGELNRAQDGLERVKAASASRRMSLTTLKSQLAKDIETSSPERLIYGKVDEIKARLKPDDMTIGALERKGGDMALPFTLTFTNPNYCNLLNAVSRLQQSVFPFTPVDSITISQGEQNGKGVVTFSIVGTVLTPERHQP